MGEYAACLVKMLFVPLAPFVVDVQHFQNSHAAFLGVKCCVNSENVASLCCTIFIGLGASSHHRRSIFLGEYAACLVKMLFVLLAPFLVDLQHFQIPHAAFLGMKCCINSENDAWLSCTIFGSLGQYSEA